MPSPVSKFMNVIKELNACGYTNQAGREQIKVAIIRITGAMKEQTLSLIIKTMHDLDFIRDTGQGALFYLCHDRYGNFPQIDKAKEKENAEAEIEAKYGI